MHVQFKKSCKKKTKMQKKAKFFQIRKIYTIQKRQKIIFKKKTCKKRMQKKIGQVYLLATKLIKNKEVDHESRPWSNISPSGEDDPVRLACFPSIPSNTEFEKKQNFSTLFSRQQFLYFLRRWPVKSSYLIGWDQQMDDSFSLCMTH